MVRDARRRRAPHHEALRPHPEQARGAVSKDEGPERRAYGLKLQRVCSSVFRVADLGWAAAGAPSSWQGSSVHDPSAACW